MASSAFFATFLVVIMSTHDFSLAHHCVMYDTWCNGICSDNGTARPLQNTVTVRYLKDLCPDLMKYGNYFCCSASEVMKLKRTIATVSSWGLGRCPSCMHNIKKNYCHLLCSPIQSRFLQVTNVVTNYGMPDAVRNVTYHVSEEYAKGLFESCKGMLGEIPGYSVLVENCIWGSDCNPIAWLHHLGKVLDEGWLHPIAITYKLHKFGNVNIGNELIHPMNESTIPCRSKKDSNECLCQGCSGACAPEDKSSSHINVAEKKTYHLTWLSFSFVFGLFAFTLLFMGVMCNCVNKYFKEVKG